MIIMMTDTNFRTAIKIVKKIVEGKINCFSFIEFEASGSAAKVIAEDNLKIGDKEVKVFYTKPERKYLGTSQNSTGRTFDLKIAGIGDSKPADVVKSFKGGRVKFVSKEKGYMLISFNDEDLMKKAQKENEELKINGEKVSVKVVKSRFRRNGGFNKSR
ncbi:hypothetical protein DMUE_1040 [Dictyocoela muelleri]|nr:hypothetical protein DMUE_1040 [Dictyocoela muelleri]